MGDSGSFCHYCNTTRADLANDLVKILQRDFSIEKSYELCQEAWRQLDTGEISYNDPARHGQCHEPICKQDLSFFAILHQKLRSMDHTIKIFQHIVSGQTHTWSESNPCVKDALKLAKVEIIDHVLKETGMLIDSPTEKGGNTSSGPLADRFFGPKEGEKICKEIKNTEDRENFSELLSKINVLLSLTQHVDSHKTVDPQKEKILGMNSWFSTSKSSLGQ